MSVLLLFLRNLNICRTLFSKLSAFIYMNYITQFHIKQPPSQSNGYSILQVRKLIKHGVSPLSRERGQRPSTLVRALHFLLEAPTESSRKPVSRSHHSSAVKTVTDLYRKKVQNSQAGESNPKFSSLIFLELQVWVCLWNPRSNSPSLITGIKRSLSTKEYNYHAS